MQSSKLHRKHMLRRRCCLIFWSDMCLITAVVLSCFVLGIVPNRNTVAVSMMQPSKQCGKSMRRRRCCLIFSWFLSCLTFVWSWVLSCLGSCLVQSCHGSFLVLGPAVYLLLSFLGSCVVMGVPIGRLSFYMNQLCLICYPLVQG
jgi:hypothetical protein